MTLFSDTLGALSRVLRLAAILFITALFTDAAQAQDNEIKFTAASDIPIGHKLAITPLKAGDTVIKYGVDIGRAVADIALGEHAHVQNIKTKRW